MNDYWDKEQFLVIDREGNKINKEIPDTVYNITIEIDSGFLAAFEERFEVLDTSFQVILSYNLSDVIEEITELNKGIYLIRTNDQSYIYHDSFYLEEIPLSPNENIIGLANYYWAANGLDQIISFDSLLQPRDTFDLSPGVEPAFILPVGDEVVSINSFWNFNGNGTLLFKGTEEELNFSLPQDIGITGLSLPDTVLFRPYHNYPWGIEFTINAIQIEVTNFGSDTIFKFHVQAPFYWSCFWCHDYVTIWEIDTIILPPGASRTVDLGDFYSDCIEGGIGNWTLCLSTIAPNDKADANFLNDTMCNKFRLLFTSTQNPIADHTINLKPIPAQDYIFVEIEEAFDHQRFGYIYDLTGKRLKHFAFNTNPEKIAVSNLASGIYVLVVSDAGGKYSSKKFLVQH